MVDYSHEEVIETDNEMSKALPENMRIGSEEELIAFLEKREKDDNGARYTSKQMKAIISKRFGITIKLLL